MAGGGDVSRKGRGSRGWIDVSRQGWVREGRNDGSRQGGVREGLNDVVRTRWVAVWTWGAGVRVGWLTVRVAPRETTAGGAPTASEPLPDPAALGYEQARDELGAIVARLESGAGTLEESLALWERGEALAARCQEWLDGARARLAAAREGAPGDEEADR